MRVALLVGAHPKRCSEGPIVRLLSGTHRFCVEGMLDSKLEIHRDGAFHSEVSDGEKIEGPCKAQIYFKDRGTEKYITVMAEQVGD